MTRGARPESKTAIPSGNGHSSRPGTTAPRGRRGTWIGSSAWIRAGAVAGVAGPAAFTLAWIIAAFRQPGLSFSVPQISGLAADNARDPWLMISGFLVLGGCAVGFGAALRMALGGRQAGPGPTLIQLAGLLAIAAGLLRRDHVLLTSAAQSWHNQAHNVISAAVYLLLIAAPLLLAWRFRHDRGWRGLAVPLVVAAVASAALLAALYADPNGGWAATLQRIGVSLPLAAVVAVAARLARLAGVRTGRT
ncbi:MAG TPA: DUF998 domain-containing protein [Streptosporangiaceae bacterium]|nr:DUF998 domain-containing protein [Streptosporangiaceae bacterium]